MSISGSITTPEMYGNLSTCSPVCMLFHLPCRLLAKPTNLPSSMSLPHPVLCLTSSKSALLPRTPTSVVTSQQRIQWQWQNLQWVALGCELFVTLLHIAIFSLDPSQAQACLLEVHCDLSHIFDPLRPWPEERYGHSITPASDGYDGP